MENDNFSFNSLCLSIVGVLVVRVLLLLVVMMVQWSSLLSLEQKKWYHLKNLPQVPLPTGDPSLVVAVVGVVTDEAPPSLHPDTLPGSGIIHQVDLGVGAVVETRNIVTG